MVSANLSGLKEYLCERPLVIPKDAKKHTIKAYPFKGDPKVKLSPNDVVGFDINGDGRLDAYVARSSSKLRVFVRSANRNPNDYVALSLWSTPIAIPRESLLMLITGHCQEITQWKVAKFLVPLAGLAGVAALVGGVRTQNLPLAMVGIMIMGADVVGFAYVPFKSATATSGIYMSLQTFIRHPDAQN